MMEYYTLSLHPGGLALTYDAAKAAGMKAGDRVLDVGCGTGTSLAHLTDLFGIVPFGIDISEETVRKAGNLHPELDIRVADAGSLPFPTGSFHHVMLECVLSLLKDHKAALSEAVRVLRPGGHLIINTLTGQDVFTGGEDCFDFDPDFSVSEQPDSLLADHGLACVFKEDRTEDLTRYMIETIMEYGGIEERVRAEQEATGASVFQCGCHPDPKKTGYYIFIYKLGEGTPVDRLTADRIGVSPEDLTQEAVEKYQLEALKRTIRYAKERSVFYRRHLAGIDPDQIRELADICRIPTTGESDLADNEREFQCLSQSRVDRIVTVPMLDGDGDETKGHGTDQELVTLPTSGTGGKRKRISYTANDQNRSVEFINRGFLTMDCREGERMLIFMSGTAPGSIGDLVARAMAPLHMDVRVYGSVTDIADAYRALTEFRPAVVEALPWHAAALARYGTRYGNPEKEYIRSVNLSADVVPDSIVERLEDLWGCSVHRHYGTTEMAIFGGVECINHKGYHTRPCDILYEIPETDPDGYGELLITTLDREAMPFIRYRTGDIAKFTDEPCPCGCRVRRIEKFKGRKSSLVILPGGAFYLSELADVLYRIPEVVDFDIVLDRAEKSGGEDPAAYACIIVRSLPGETVKTAAVEEAVHSLVSDGVDSGGKSNPVMCIRIEETAGFPSGYNLKKKPLTRREWSGKNAGEFLKSTTTR